MFVLVCVLLRVGVRVILYSKVGLFAMVGKGCSRKVGKRMASSHFLPFYFSGNKTEINLRAFRMEFSLTTQN